MKKKLFLLCLSLVGSVIFMVLVGIFPLQVLVFLFLFPYADVTLPFLPFFGFIVMAVLLVFLIQWIYVKILTRVFKLVLPYPWWLPIVVLILGILLLFAKLIETSFQPDYSVLHKLNPSSNSLDNEFIR
jgi:hypothetical protein